MANEIFLWHCNECDIDCHSSHFDECPVGLAMLHGGGPGQSKPYANEVLNEREKTHGDYKDTARISQLLKNIIYQEDKRLGSKLSQVQAESLDLICTKIGRILSGDSNFKDAWTDIAGYANLVSERLK